MYTKQDFFNVNQDKKLNSFDYLHAMFSVEALPIDIVNTLSTLFYPEFILKNNCVFLLETFEQSKFDEFTNSNLAITDIQYWMNLVEITGIFEFMTSSSAKALATKLSDSWNLQLTAKFGADIELSRVVFDEDTDEVYIVIGKTPKTSQQAGHTL